jgi:hypothetical protein
MVAQVKSGIGGKVNHTFKVTEFFFKVGSIGDTIPFCIDTEAEDFGHSLDNFSTFFLEYKQQFSFLIGHINRLGI